jgi:flagellar FliL protein
MAIGAETDANGEGKPSRGGNSAFIIALVILALIGAGAGAGFSMMFLKSAPQGDHASAGTGDASAKQARSADKVVKAAAGPEASSKGGKEGEGRKEMVKDLEPILVTLAGPQRGWARLELGVILTEETKEDQTPLLKAMAEDMMSFLRTIPLTHIETAAGVEYLREDLTEIARLRSKGRVRTVVMRSLVVE